MAVQADLFGDNNNNNQNMGLGFPFSLPLPVMPQDWLVPCSSSYMGIEENKSVCFQENSMQQTPINNPQFHQVFQFIGPNNININQEAAVPGPSSYASSSSSILLPMDFSQFLASELEKQRVDMESYLQLQNERLRLVLREETRQRGVVLQKYATKLMSLVQQKDKELALANNRRLELQQYLIKSDFELKTWKLKAMENEALILDLTNKINQVKERLSLVSNGVPDSESICDSSSKSSMVIKNSSDNYFCKVCHVRSSCVLLLPCRHLCCCQSCEGFLEFCPVCEGVKKASIEVFLA